MWTGGWGVATLATPAQTFRSMIDLNSWFLTVCVPSNSMSFGVSLLREVLQFQSFSVLIKGNCVLTVGGLQKTEKATTLSP
jgi:hypothetical protein